MFLEKQHKEEVLYQQKFVLKIIKLFGLSIIEKASLPCKQKTGWLVTFWKMAFALL